ncbi:VOC family protein [Carboxydothermus ferrireducens]|uniref:Catechol 2,3-dioxygenase-like lactoylglutathione lyase family enzyme n=1 Tax=Carboxydothermus ferrireducens DSM 11255 TaxID=1119529 RepID=A0ABX2R697_9THEO|nr:VOC family protein [Carboxydothermus ferrireducens]NYE56484.1 catechol 2,3-dioxygenase-like lactoylglutathione lyase family enzyme [Carboxydothermus ferrireducens DSM 11255]
MDLKLSHVTLFVRDQEEALAWYTEKLGFVKREDNNFGHGVRWLTISPANQPEIEFVLFKPFGEKAEEQLKLVGKNGTWVFLTSDCRKTCEELAARGVEIVSPPQEVPWGVSALFKDLYGNIYNLVERK